MASAARSFTEPPGLRNSALPRISQPVIADTFRSRISGVLPIASLKPLRIVICKRSSKRQRGSRLAGELITDLAVQRFGRGVVQCV